MKDKIENPAAFGSDTEFGMTLRDYFAGQALPSLMRADMRGGINKVVEGTELDVQTATAYMAYIYADAMLEARLK